MCGDYETGKRYLIDIHPENFKVPDGFSFCRENDSLIVSREKSKSYEKITVTKDGIEVISNNGNVFYERENIRQIFYKWDSMKYNRFSLFIVLNNMSDNNTVILLSEIPLHLFSRYIEQEAEKILGIDDDIVIGECDAELKKSGYDKMNLSYILYKINPDSAVFKPHTPIAVSVFMHFLGFIFIAIGVLISWSISGSDYYLTSLSVILFVFIELNHCNTSTVFSVRGDQFEVIEKSDMLIHNKLLKSGSISDIDYVYMLDIFEHFKDFKDCIWFDLRIKFKNSTDDYVLFSSLYRNTAEFLQKTINETFHFNGNFKGKVNLNKY